MYVTVPHHMYQSNVQYVGADRPSQPDSQAFNEHCETTDTGCITRYACLLLQLTPGTHPAWADSG